jgi:hypothetical protein
MSAINFIETTAAPAVTTLMLACLPLAFIGFFVQGL